MKFESITRNGVVYEYDKEYSYESNKDHLSDHYYEFETYGDGMTQHSPRRLVYPVNAIDFFASFARFLLDNRSAWTELDRFDYNHNMVNRKDVEFFLKLKYDPDKRVYYNPSELKKSTAESKGYDKRWFEVPTWADGSMDAVFSFTCKSFYTFLERFRVFNQVRELIYEIDGSYRLVDSEKYFQMDHDTWRHLKDAISVIEYIYQSVWQSQAAESAFSCLSHNWIDHHKTEEQQAA